MFKKLKHAIQNWWRCRTKRCEYYRHYLAYGPADLVHEGYHAAEKLASQHFANCRYDGPGICQTCRRWEDRVRA